jgi:putative chitinase
LAHFLAQISHESGGFKILKENLNYSAERLRQIFPKYFPGNLNESYAKKPEKIANKVYSSRMGNGDESSGDGWKFAGRGYLQLTGKFNYAEFDKTVPEDILENPDLVATKYPLTSAAFFFQKNKIWRLCDLGATEEVVTQVTEKINGGRIGLDHRRSEFTKFHGLLFS